MIRRPPRSTPFPTRRSSDLRRVVGLGEMKEDGAALSWHHRRVVEADDDNQVVKGIIAPRSEEHTSELQSQSNRVCRLLLEKTKLQPWRRSCTLPALALAYTP